MINLTLKTVSKLNGGEYVTKNEKIYQHFRQSTKFFAANNNENSKNDSRSYFNKTKQKQREKSVLHIIMTS